MNVFATEAATDLYEHAIIMGKAHIASLIQQNNMRFEEFDYNICGLMLDLFKQRITAETLQFLYALAREKNLKQWIEYLNSGKKINTSEHRPALNTALRAPAGQPLKLDGEDIIINIGVGGSNLGPFIASEFTTKISRKVEIHFVSVYSMDCSHISSMLDRLNPTHTLFVISSESFTTIDTWTNADSTKEWIKRSDQHEGMDEALLLKGHFIRISAAPQRMINWDIPESNHLYFWKSTRRHHSMRPITIGQPIALRIGIQGFQDMLAGANTMDMYFRNTEFESNLPVLLALTGIWKINLFRITTHAILPYDSRLSHMSSYLKQLNMKSNDKNTTYSNEMFGYNTCPVLWGEIGTNAQYAFYQLLYQGTTLAMCDFITRAIRFEAPNNTELKHQHQLNISNCLAQSQILILHPDQFPLAKTLVIGCQNNDANQVIKVLYKHFNRSLVQMMIIKRRRAEFMKFAVNGKLSLRLCDIIELANIARLLHIDIGTITAGMDSDQRIGNHDLSSSCGFGGPHFSKSSIQNMAELLKNNRNSIILNTLLEANEKQKVLPFRKLRQRYKANVTDLQVVVWGLSFKLNTASIQNAPNFLVVEALLAQGSKVHAHGAKAMLNCVKHFPSTGQISYYHQAIETLKYANTLIILTEWNEYYSPVYYQMLELVKKPFIIDGGNFMERNPIEGFRFFYYGVGR